MVETEVAELNAAYTKAVANRDIDGVMSVYAQNARLLAPGAPMVQGTEAVRAVFQGYIDAGANSLDVQTIDLIEAGDVVIDVGRYVLNIQPEGSDLIVDHGKYVDVFRRQSDGSLKMIVDIFNSDAPSPEG